MLRRTLQLAEMMVEVADQGDAAREDVGCGVLYGLLRDSAYKIKKVAEQEKEDHIRRGVWPEERAVPGRGAVLRKNSDRSVKKTISEKSQNRQKSENQDQ
ncbi:MAG TPA: hypothetical protein VEF34_05350 [Syntrophobacteraceae bacterium]|nr:hypothetical protein [Syntrophobacteraceae bacterium]